MTRIISLMLFLAMIFISSYALTSCTEKGEDNTPSPPLTPSGGEDEEIYSPHLGEHTDRRTVKFSEITYARPEIEALCDEIRAIALEIESAETPYESTVDRIISADGLYENAITMYTYAKIMTSKDSSDRFWNDEYSYISLLTPSLSKAIEDMLVAAARSENAEKYEDECFGEGLIEKYRDGGVYTDELVSLYEKETELENRYSSLSTANVTVTYKGRTDTVDAIIGFYLNAYGESSETYNNALYECQRLYEAEKSRITVDTYVELVKTRRDIADELGDASYTTRAYDAVGHDYTPEEALGYLDTVAREIVPVYAALQYYVFSPYFQQNSAPAITNAKLINSLYDTMADMSGELGEIYSYMLNYSLYDVGATNDTRFNGSFTTYLDSLDAPYLFVSAKGECTDILTLAHEFGHFADSFINFDSSTSIDLAEVSSTALELLTYARIKDEVDAQTAKHLHYAVISDALSVMVYQSFYALFEHYVYEIDESEISEQAIKEAMMSAAHHIGLNTAALQPNPKSGVYNALDYVLIPHTVERPFYVESYCTSMTAALEIYFLECDGEGEGVSVYMDLIHREGELSFLEHLSEVGLSSPFDETTVITVADGLYYDILGSYKQDENKIQSIKPRQIAA